MKITAQAPTRISLFGGGTDLPVFSDKYGGLVISMAINIHKTITFSDEGKNNSLDERFVKAFLDEYGVNYSFEEGGDGVFHGGLGGSASMAVAIVAALDPLLSKEERAEKAWQICNNRLGLYSGKQDEYAASFGGMNTILFTKNEVVVTPVDRDTALFWKDRILLFDTGERRVNPKLQENLKTLRIDREMRLQMIKAAAEAALPAIESRNVKEVAWLIRDSWSLKSGLPWVSNEKIDRIYHAAFNDEERVTGEWALAGKLLGSGGGGYMAFLVEPKKQKKVIEKLEQIEGVKHCKFSIDWEGAKII